jgi:hypothetical protein
MKLAHHLFVLGFALSLLSMAIACGQAEESKSWTLDRIESEGALLSVWGSGPDDIWVAGGQSGKGVLIHGDGTSWSPVAVDADQLLWWVYGFSSDDVYAVGERGLALHYDGEAWAKFETGTDATLYGVWGASGEDVWIVGGDPYGATGSAVVLRGSGTNFENVLDVPEDMLPSALFKVYGGPAGLMAVGTSGTVLRYDGASWDRDGAPTDEPIFSLWGRADDDIYAVGGTGVGEVLHYDGEAWNRVNDDGLGDGLSGVFTAPGQPTIAVGNGAYVIEIGEDGSMVEPLLPVHEMQPTLHGVWGDGTGTTYAVGGDLPNYPGLMRGVIYKRD